MEPVYFSSPDEFRQWLQQNHDSESEILVGYYKVGTGRPSLTWSQSVDEAICFGWIDGIRRSIDSERYCIRFTPRNPGSNWSNVNIKKAEELISNGKMTKAGLEVYKKRKASRSGIYSFENRPAKLDAEMERIFISNKKAWEFFNNQAPSYRRTVMHWILDGKQESTRFRRLEKVIKASEKGSRVT